jgi:hypothetical protein
LWSEPNIWGSFDILSSKTLSFWARCIQTPFFFVILFRWDKKKKKNLAAYKLLVFFSSPSNPVVSVVLPRLAIILSSPLQLRNIWQFGLMLTKIVWIKSLGGSKCEASQTSGGLLTFSVPKRCHFECDVYKPPSSNSSSSSAETKKT